MDLIFQNFKLLQIEFLNLSDNSISDKGSSELYRFLRENGSLQELRLSKCNLNGEAASQIFQCLLANEKLSGMVLKIPKNKIGSGKKQCEVFKNVLKNFSGKKTFDELKITDNKLSSESLNDIVQTLLNNNYNIKKLCIGDKGHLYRHAFRKKKKFCFFIFIYFIYFIYFLFILYILYFIYFVLFFNILFSQKPSKSQ